MSDTDVSLEKLLDEARSKSYSKGYDSGVGTAAMEIETLKQHVNKLEIQLRNRYLDTHESDRTLQAAMNGQRICNVTVDRGKDGKPDSLFITMGDASVTFMGVGLHWEGSDIGWNNPSSAGVKAR